MFGDIFNQLFHVAAEDELQWQLQVNEELRNNVANTLTQQVYHEKEIIASIGNLTAEEDKLSERMSPFEEKHGLNRERSLRTGGHCFILMKDVDCLEDILEAVVKGWYTPDTLPSCPQRKVVSVTTFEYLNLTTKRAGVTVKYLT